MISRKILTQIIKQSGLSAFGISQPALEEKYISRYKEWLGRKFNADMIWTEKNHAERMNIRKRFPWVRSVLVVLDNYFKENNLGNNPKISCYARGEDYHIVVAEKLQKVLSVLINIEKKIKGKIFVDCGAVLEKAYAEQAGLGWIGKNGLLIGEDIGSFCFIGVLLLNQDIQPSVNGVEKCGDCKLCVDNCPNGAIVSPGLIDVRKCISYLTIEKKGEFSEKESHSLNNWLFGCDMCQEVCPYNQMWAVITDEERYQDIDQFDLSLREWKNVDLEKYDELFEKTPIKRLKYKRLQRNINALDKTYNNNIRN